MPPHWRAPKMTITPAPTVPIPAADILIPAAVIPIPAAVIHTPAAVIPIPATVVPIHATVAIRTILPLRYRDNSPAHADSNRPQPTVDEGESFDLDNVSGDDEEEEHDPPAPTVRAPAGPSPLQTAMHNVHPTQTTLLDTGSLTKMAKGTDDFHFIFRLDEVTGRNVCIPCEQLHELDLTYKVTTYKTTMSNTGPRHHVYNHHTLIYLEEAGRQGWPIQIMPLNTLLEEGWMVTAIHERLRDPTRTIDLLGDVPNHNDTLLRTGQPGTLKDEIPNFTLDEMH
ncbi:hypothetical protein EV702DRAFT_1040898 [Suillus placidus]|uniref:Uncharacterized protein n=1 Tax=Suillus placidus TaxID=48579 RepID=A0A9P7A6I9_9AGAM|nr:hypothetical protein EV702DRAFT_1040898 [Suillus placidus]